MAVLLILSSGPHKADLPTLSDREISDLFTQFIGLCFLDDTTIDIFEGGQDDED